MNDEPLLLGTDIGTQGTKTLLVDLKGHTIASALQEYGFLQPRPLWAEQWPDVWLEAVCATVRRVLQQAQIDPVRIIGWAISGLYGGSGIPVDREMGPLRPCLIWMDRRATQEVKWVQDHMDLDKLFRITGNIVDTYYGFTKILWIKNKEAEIWRRIYKLVPPNSYVIYKLTGELAIDYSSAGNIGGIFDLHQRRWSKELLQELGIPLQMMPERLVASSEIVGHLTREGAELTGLWERMPIVAGGVDAAVATFSAGAFEVGDHVAMVGTSMCWGVIHEGERLSPELVSMPYVAFPEQKIYTWGGAATAGAVARWFRDQFGQLEIEAAAKTGIDPFTLLDLEAEQVPPGAEGLLALPHFMGERAPLWDSAARGTVLGLTLYHTRAHLFRALLEGVAYGLRHCTEVGQKLGFPLREACILVGGAAKSRLWTQILTNVTGYAMTTVRGGGEAALGDAFLAGIGVGVFKDYREIQNWLNFEDPTQPCSELHALYTNFFQLYLQTHQNLRDVMKGLAKA